MEIKFITQPIDSDGNVFLLGDKLKDLLQKRRPFYKKVWFISGFAKEMGLFRLESDLRKCALDGVDIQFILGIDRKTTTKETLNKLLSFGCNIKIYNNNNTNVSFQPKLFIFESPKKIATALITSSSITEGGLFSNNELITQMTFKLNDEKEQKEYKDFLASIKNILENEKLVELNKKVTEDLYQKGELLDSTKQRGQATKIMSISEYTHETLEIKVEEKEEEIIQTVDGDPIVVELPTGESIEVDLNTAVSSIEEKLSEEDINQTGDNNQDQKMIDEIDIEVDMTKALEYVPKVSEYEPKKIDKKTKVKEHIEQEEHIEEEEPKQEHKDYNNQEENMIKIYDFDAIDVEQMLFEQQQANKVKDQQPEETHVEIKPVKKINIIKDNTQNFDNANIFIFEIDKISKRGASKNQIKVPSNTRDLTSKLWGYPEGYKVEEVDGKRLKTRIANIKIEDVSTKDVFEDKCTFTQIENESVFSISSEKLVSLDIQENDIIRIIKLNNVDVNYKFEIIRQSSNEYGIWQQFCKYPMKGSKKHFGIQ